VVGVASETGLVLLRLAGGDLGELVALLDRLDARPAGGKQLRFDGPLGVSELGTPILGLATSSLRISLLLDQGAIPDALRRLHRGMIDAA
jgi:hypothetical protein